MRADDRAARIPLKVQQRMVGYRDINQSRVNRMEGLARLLYEGRTVDRCVGYSWPVKTLDYCWRYVEWSGRARTQLPKFYSEFATLLSQC